MDKKISSEDYQKRKTRFKKLKDNFKRRLNIISFLRLLTFLGGTAMTLAGFSFGVSYGIPALAITIFLFLLLVKYYVACTNRHDFYSNLVEINQDEIQALSGDYSRFEPGERWINGGHDFSNDTDLFGKESLFQYLNRTVTGYGRSILAGWLSDPLNLCQELAERQEAIKELTGKLDWRQEFTAHGLNRSLEEEDIRGLLDWLGEKSSFFASWYLRILIFVAPALTIPAFFMLIAGYIHYSVFTFLFLVNLLITAIALKRTNRIHSMVSRKYRFLSSFNRLIQSFEEEDFLSAILLKIKNKICSDRNSVIHRIKTLGNIIQSFDSRLNLIIGFVLNGFFLWDLHCVRSLERWKRQSVKLLPGWLDYMGQVDAFNSLANYAFNNPGYAWPVLTGDGTVLEARGIGHPLIEEESRICNDFRVNKEGLVIIITGANMAGKSTFLRTVAVNFILGMAGAPVCAGEMRFKPVKLFTSMRTIDSLSRNESYFYAELRRLKVLKEKIEKEKQVLFILDEILKGTNSKDKTRGSQLFIRKIIELGGTGLIATHDTSLAELESNFPGIILNKCFEIEIEGDKINFDFRLRDGVTTKMNAALLMKEMGITD
jgi:DNA mismatch repair ATPase MutS